MFEMEARETRDPVSGKILSLALQASKFLDLLARASFPLACV